MSARDASRDLRGGRIPATDAGDAGVGERLLDFFPRQAPTRPVLDAITLRATSLWRAGALRAPTPRDMTRARFATRCSGEGCEATSLAAERVFPNGRRGDALLVHRVACHRAECSDEDLLLIAWLPPSARIDDCYPTRDELWGDLARDASR